MENDQVFIPTVRDVKIILAKLKLRFLFRIFFLMLGWTLLWCGIAQAKWLFMVLGAVAMGLPSLILMLFPSAVGGAFTTLSLLYDAGFDSRIRYGFFDRIAEGGESPLMTALSVLVLIIFGFAFNIREIIRIMLDYSMMRRLLPPRPNDAKSSLLRITQGLILPIVLLAAWTYLGAVIGGAIGGNSTGREDPVKFYSIEDKATAEEKTALIESLSDLIRGTDYFYYVDMGFDADGFTRGIESDLMNGSRYKVERAAYQACVSHTNNGSEIWEFSMTLDSEGRGKTWSDDANIKHPIYFDQSTGSATVYIVDTGSTRYVYYRDESGSWKRETIDKAPEVYSAFIDYLLLPADQIDMMTSGVASCLCDNGTDTLKFKYETDTATIGVAIKDKIYPFNVYVSFKDDFTFDTDAVRFSGTNTIVLPI